MNTWQKSISIDKAGEGMGVEPQESVVITVDSDKHRLIAQMQVNCYRGFISNIGEEINLFHNNAPVTTSK